MAINEEARIPVYLNDEQAKSALKNLQNEADKWREKMQKAMAGGDMKGMKDAEREMKKVQKEASKFRKATFDTNEILKNLSTAKPKELKQALRELSREQDKFNRGTKEYIAYGKKMGLVRTELNKISNELRTQRSLTSRVADGFNKYFGMATAAIASLTGIAFTIKSSIKAFAEFDDKVSDVMKTTGLTKDQVMSLNKELEKIDTRTSQQNLLDLARVAGKLGITAEKDVLGFVRAADKIKVALSEDLGGDVEESINQLGKLVDIFKLQDKFGIEQSLLKVGSAINSLGAAGTANEAYLVEFAKRVAGIAPAAGISIDQVLGLGATLDELGQTSEVSGTTYAKVISSMFTKTASYAKIAKIEVAEFTKLLDTDANEAFIKVLEGAKGTSDGFAEMATNLGELGLDGARSTAVLSTLGNNIDKLREKQAYSNAEFVKGTSIQQEFNTKNQNAQATLEKAQKVFAQMQRELGERLAPAYTSVIHKGSAMIKMLGITIEFLFDNRKALITAAVAIGSYTIAVNAATWSTKIYNSVTTLATTITKGFNTAIKANPVGLIISLLTTAATAFYLFSQKADDAKKSQKRFNDEIERGNELLGQSKTLEERASIVKNLSKEQLENLKNDLQAQVKEEENFHATLLQKAKKAVDEDAELKRIAELRKQKNLTEIQKINLTAQANARAIAITRELEDENKTNQQRLVNLKKHLTNVDTELKKRPDEGGGGLVTSGNFEAIKKSLESAFTKEQNILKEQFLQKKLTKKQYDDEMYVLELANLTAMRELYKKHNQDFLSIEGQILDKKLAWSQQFDAMMEISQSITERILEDEKKMFADIDSDMDKYMDDYQKKLDKQTEATIESEEKKTEAREKAKEAAIGAAVESGMAAIENAETIEDAGKAILNSIRQQIKAYIAEAVTIAALKALKSVPFPINIIAAAIAGGAAGFLFNKLIPEFSAGGDTGSGGKYEPAGIVHKEEYVIPQEGTKNPQLRPIIDIMEIARRNGSLARLDLRQIVQAIPAKGYSSGGFASPTDSISPPSSSKDGAGGGSYSDPAILKKFDDLATVISNLKIYTSIEDIRKSDKNYTEIQNTRGL
ncbi:phage tail tape measure protein [Mangrovibacterium sp.]|uniref:phage tail tape measure protein n=1 Tax=Mangrovibacterium sp. TaxID=1961364 RepID=UPI0035635FEE